MAAHAGGVDLSEADRAVVTVSAWYSRLWERYGVLILTAIIAVLLGSNMRQSHYIEALHAEQNAVMAYMHGIRAQFNAYRVEHGDKPIRFQRYNETNETGE